MTYILYFFILGPAVSIPDPTEQEPVDSYGK